MASAGKPQLKRQLKPWTIEAHGCSRKVQGRIKHELMSHIERIRLCDLKTARKSRGGDLPIFWNRIFMRKTLRKLALTTSIVVALNLLPSDQSGAGPGSKKVTLCHKGQTMELPESAVQAHLNHGDTLGPCSVTPSQNR